MGTPRITLSDTATYLKRSSREHKASQCHSLRWQDDEQVQGRQASGVPLCLGVLGRKMGKCSVAGLDGNTVWSWDTSDLQK